MPTGETVDASDSSEASRMLYTVYTVQLSDSFKGENPHEIKIYRIGGLIGYKESVQYSMIEKAGFFDEYHGFCALLLFFRYVNAIMQGGDGSPNLAGMILSIGKSVGMKVMIRSAEYTSGPGKIRKPRPEKPKNRRTS